MAVLHPWDIKQVSKGWQLTPTELTTITQTKPDTKKYRLAVVGLANRLERELREEGHEEWTVAEVKGCLRVLTDEEADEYNAKQGDQGVRRIRKACRKLGGVDTSSFSQEQIQMHDRRVMVAGFRVAALHGVRTAVRRSLAATTGSPSLPGGNGGSTS